MPSVEVTAQKLGSEALNNVATLNQISNNYIGIWNLENTGSDVPTDVEFFPYKNYHFDSRINIVDKRQQVPDADILPGGKYRSIVKLFLRYTNQKASDPWTIGTGWLIAPDLIVTAGHYAFDWSYKRGQLTQVKAYVGYNGKASVDDPQTATQFQQGGQVATPSEWLRSKGMKAYDVAFIKVRQPFTGIVPFDFEDTPRSALSNIGLVGYAGDITDRFSGEKGAHVYQVFQNTEWNLEKSEYTMLEYALDPYGGNSGSPVFHQDRLVSIGTHVQGGNPGLGSAIGYLGNPYKNYVATFSADPKIPGQEGSQTAGSVRYIRVSTTEELPQNWDVQTPYRNQTSNNDVESIDVYQSKNHAFDYQTQVNGSSSGDQSNGVRYQSQPMTSDYQPKSNVSNTQAATNDGRSAPATSSSDSDFLEILKLGIKLSDPVLSDILDVHSPIVLGPIGSPLGALAGAILASAGKLATTHSAPVYDFRQGLPYDGVLERAILGEAAFTVVMSMKRRKLEEIGIFADMAEIVNKMAPITKQLAPFFMHILTAPALRVALHALYDDPGRSRSRPEVTASSSSHENRFAQPYTPSARTLEPGVDTFLKQLLAHCISDDEGKNSFDNINRIIQIGFREAGPVLTTTAHEGLQYLTSTLPNAGVQGPGIPSHKPYIVGLPERAILGEAALQALIKAPKHHLDEGAFDIMAQTIDSIGGIVLRLAPGLIEDVGFSVKALAVVPLISADGIVDDSKSAPTDAGEASQATANRQAKGFSFVNLEQEFLNYYRDNTLKPMQPIVEV